MARSAIFRAVTSQVIRCSAPSFSRPGMLLGSIPLTNPLTAISRQQLYDIINERKPVSPGVAARLGKMFGDGAAVWLRMQAAYDGWHAERDTDVSGIPTLRPA